MQEVESTNTRIHELQAATKVLTAKVSTFSVTFEASTVVQHKARCQANRTVFSPGTFV